MKSEHTEIIQKAFIMQSRHFETHKANFTQKGLFDHVVSEVQPKKTDHVLEVAVGTCICGRVFAPFVHEVTCLDVTPAMLAVGKTQAEKQAYNNMMFVTDDAEKLPFLDYSFDVVISRLTFHHFPNTELPFSEMTRVLKKDGKLVLIDMEAAEEQQNKWRSLTLVDDAGNKTGGGILKHFLIDKNYDAYLSKMGFSIDKVLKKAMLPEDLFAHQIPNLTVEEYFRLMQAIDALSPDSQTPIRLAISDGIEAFFPPIFAAYCSQNALVCLKRLAQYKPLIGALLYQVAETDTEVSVEILSDNSKLELPEILIGIEFVFLVGLIRKATKEQISPLSATTKHPMQNQTYADYMRIPIVTGTKNQLVFSKADAQIPFISRNESMWEFFEPELKRRLSMMETDDSYAARVRSALMELLPSGACAIDDVAKKLGYSKHSLQRKLQEENTNFQKQLNHTRKLLAKTYLTNTEMSAEDIAFLLGYQETGSFLRAFSLWTGQTVSEYRNEMH